MKNELHVVLGASGSIGQSVIEELQSRKLSIRAIARNKKFEGVEVVSADLLDLDQAISAISGASYVYLCVGLPYNTKIWHDQWPQIMSNVIKACEIAKAKLIFLDNIYMYGPSPLDVPLTENHSRIPVSKKGITRKAITGMLWDAHNAGRVRAVVGRSADFYGPRVESSPLYISFIENMLNGKNPSSLGKTEIKHTYAFTKDNGRALVALALDDRTYGQEWHLPVCRPVTIDEVVTQVNHILGSNFKATVIPRRVLKLMGLFVPPIHEIYEMLYQADYPYIMSDEKFRNHFPDFKVTEFETGIEMMVNSFKS